MNGNWFSWSERTNVNQPGEYVAAWRHVHDISPRPPEGSQTALNSFATGIQNSRYVGNAYGSISATPIPTP
jgi:beta-mannanase